MAHIAMIVTNRYDPDPRVQKEAASLVQAGHRVVVYAFDRQGEIEAREERLQGVEIRRLRPRVSDYGRVVPVLLGLSAFGAEVRRQLLRDPPDALHCHDHDTCFIGYWWQKWGARAAGQQRATAKVERRGLFVFDVHDLYWTRLLSASSNRLLRRAGAKLLQASDRFYARAADLLITATDAVDYHPGLAAIYREWGCDPLTIWNAPLPVQRLPPLPERFTVGYFGSIRDLDMFRWLVDAIARLPPESRPDLRVAGAGVLQAEVGSLLQSASDRLGLRLQLGGRFAPWELPELMAGCSVQYCVYSLEHGNMDRAVPVKLFDSIVNGRPVIGNSDCLMGDFIARYGAGWTAPAGDVPALAAALSEAGRRLEHGRPPAPLTSPPLWPEQGSRLAEAYSRILG